MPETPETITRFQVGTRYAARDLWSWTVISRTAKFLTIRDDSNGQIKKVGALLDERNRREWARPLGHYSMCPTIASDIPLIVEAA